MDVSDIYFKQDGATSYTDRGKIIIVRKNSWWYFSKWRHLMAGKFVWIKSLHIFLWSYVKIRLHQSKNYALSMKRLTVNEEHLPQSLYIGLKWKSAFYLKKNIDFYFYYFFYLKWNLLEDIILNKKHTYDLKFINKYKRRLLIMYLQKTTKIWVFESLRNDLLQRQ